MREPNKCKYQLRVAKFVLVIVLNIFTLQFTVINECLEPIKVRARSLVPRDTLCHGVKLHGVQFDKNESLSYANISRIPLIDKLSR